VLSGNVNVTPALGGDITRYGETGIAVSVFDVLGSGF
jgi:hypothetical protein